MAKFAATKFQVNFVNGDVGFYPSFEAALDAIEACYPQHDFERELDDVVHEGENPSWLVFATTRATGTV